MKTSVHVHFKVQRKWDVWDGEFSACTNFFLDENLCPLFFRQILLFFNREILIHCLCFCVLEIILHSQQIKGYSILFNAKSFRNFTYSGRGGSHLEWTAFLCIFSVPAVWNASPTPIHQNSPSVVPSTPKRRGMYTRSWKGKQKRAKNKYMYQLAVRKNQTRRKKKDQP